MNKRKEVSKLSKKIILFRVGSIKKYSSMYNYYKKCVLPLADELKTDGYEIVIQKDSMEKGFRHMKYYLKNRKHLKHILGLIIDEFQILKFRRKNKNNLVIVSMNQLLPNILSAKYSMIIIHDIMPLEFKKDWPTLSKYYKYYLSMMLNKCNFIISVSETTKNKIKEFYGISENKIKNIYNGIIFSNSDVEKEVMKKGSFLYVGANLPNKNLKFLVETFIKTKSKQNINMISSCCENKDVKNIATKSDRVNLLGSISEEELIDQYKNCTALIYPSISEGFGLPLIEAMWYCKKIIVADKDYAREICKDYPGTIYFNADRPEELIEIIENIDSYKLELDQKKIREMISKKYSWDDAVQNLKKLIIR